MLVFSCQDSALIEKPEWEIATFLPMADWNKASASTVYKDSRKML